MAAAHQRPQDSAAAANGAAEGATEECAAPPASHAVAAQASGTRSSNALVPGAEHDREHDGVPALQCVEDDFGDLAVVAHQHGLGGPPRRRRALHLSGDPTLSPPAEAVAAPATATVPRGVTMTLPTAATTAAPTEAASVPSSADEAASTDQWFMEAVRSGLGGGRGIRQMRPRLLAVT